MLCFLVACTEPTSPPYVYDLSEEIESLNWTADNSTLYAVVRKPTRSEDEYYIRSFDTKGALLKEVKVPNAEYNYGVRFSLLSDSRYAVVANYNSLITIVDLTTGEIVARENGMLSSPSYVGDMFVILKQKDLSEGPYKKYTIVKATGQGFQTVRTFSTLSNYYTYLYLAAILPQGKVVFPSFDSTNTLQMCVTDTSFAVIKQYPISIEFDGIPEVAPLFSGDHFAILDSYFGYTFDLNTGDVKYINNTVAAYRAYTVSQDGKYYFTIDMSDRSIHKIDASSGSFSTLTPPLESNQYARYFSVSRNDKYLAYSLSENRKNDVVKIVELP